MTTSKLSLLKTDMDLQTAKNAVRTARIAWHDTIAKTSARVSMLFTNSTARSRPCRSGFLTTIPRPQTRMQPIRSGWF